MLRWQMEMIKETNNISDIKYILDNLREEDRKEVFSQLGSKWKEKLITYFSNKTVKVLYGLNYEKKKIPIAMGGFSELSEKDPLIACVWLLSTDFVLKNKRLFFTEIQKQLKMAENKYSIMYNFIYKSNYTAKGWLKKFGFKFDNPYPKYLQIKDGFEFFYKFIER